jgi:Flp pilus assembly protein TadG
MSMRSDKKNGRRMSLKDDTDGSVILEAALVMPLVVLLVAGIADYGVTLYQYHTLSTATGSAVRQLIVSRGFANPYSGVQTQFSNWAPNLSITTAQFKVYVADSAGTLQECTSNATCKTALDAAAGRQGSVSVNYACTTTFIPSMASPCPIKISASGMIE